MKSTSKIACLSLIAASAMHVGADNFTPLVLPDRDTDIRAFSDGTTYAPLFSAGSQQLGGVPFQFVADASGDTAYIGSPALHIPVNISGVTAAYTLINTVCGTQGSLAGTLTFNGSGGLSYGVNLTVGVNVRDHFYGTYINTTSDPSTVDAVWGDANAGHAHLDMQTISLPAAFAAATLQEIIFEPLGGCPAGRAFLVAATVANPPPAVGDPVITLNGTNPMAVECHAAFTDPAATAHDANGASLDVTMTGVVDTNSPGSYTLTYSATDASGNTANATRTVNVVDTTKPEITLNGTNPTSVECHTAFAEPGATANDTCTGNLAVTISGTVDTNTPGTYTLTYTASDPSGNTAVATRTVTVVDTTQPVITLNGPNPLTVECHGVFIDPGATAIDACAGSIAVAASGNVNANTPGSYTLTYTANDPSANTATVTRTVNVVDATKPVITLNGANPLMVECHSAFNEPGATANDACAGSVAVSASGTVDPNTPGTYTLTYSAVDPSGNFATATRRVNVIDTTPPVISLNGANPLTIPCQTPFTDPGATANDACAGVVAVSVSGSVDVNTPGSYTLTYSASDPSGNTESTTRTVTVACATGAACPFSQGYWKTHSKRWPVASLTLGSQSYSQVELLALLNGPVGSDASLILAKQLIAAKLNIANGSDATPVAAQLAEADRFLEAFAGKLPYSVKPSSATGKAMALDAGVLDTYNSDGLTPGCVQ